MGRPKTIGIGKVKQRLLEAADRRFYADGINATGIDAITAEAGVAKMSLYNNFESKDDLIVAYLDCRRDEWFGFLNARTRGAKDPIQRVLAVFDAYYDHAFQSCRIGFRGCGLINGAAELPIGHPGRDSVRATKEEVREILVLRCMAAELTAPDEIANHLFLLLEGGMASAGVEETLLRIQDARRFAEQILGRSQREPAATRP